MNGGSYYFTLSELKDDVKLEAKDKPQHTAKYNGDEKILHLEKQGSGLHMRVNCFTNILV